MMCCVVLRRHIYAVWNARCYAVLYKRDACTRNKKHVSIYALYLLHSRYSKTRNYVCHTNTDQHTKTTCFGPRADKRAKHQHTNHKSQTHNHISQRNSSSSLTCHCRIIAHAVRSVLLVFVLIARVGYLIFLPRFVLVAALCSLSIICVM